MMERKSLALLPERFPLACQWEITCRCNLRCIMCYTDCFNRPDKIRDELSTAEILRIMDELADAGCLELCLTGGEPLARPDFFDIYGHAKAKGFLVTLFTNGTLITEEAADRLATLPPHRIEISLHGLTERTFEEVTQGRGSHARCMNAIRLLLGGKFTLMDYLIWNEIPTVLGNLVGGLSFTGLTLYATHVKTAPKHVLRRAA